MIIDETSEEIQQQYLKYCDKAHQSVKDMIEDTNITSCIGVLIEEYEASKLVLADLEYEYEVSVLRYQERFHQLKTEYMTNGLKSTEAKEKANNTLSEQRVEQLGLERDISLLKANIHSLEYQLRFKFLQYKDTMGLTYMDIMEAR